ncbi:MAG: methylenetetrahydrofolate reductase C-terminal domain-containing protein, partial [Rhizobiaceae bacterium]
MSEQALPSTTAAGPGNQPEKLPPAAATGVTQATIVKKTAPKSDYKPADVSPQRRVQRRYAVRLWSVRHSRFLEWFYARFADMFLALHPLWKSIGYGRVEG